MSRSSLGELPEVLNQQIKVYEKHLKIDDSTLVKVMQKMLGEMKKGLNIKTNPQAAVKMIPSFVEALPDGTEEGSFIALDLGGTNFRVLLVKITPSKNKAQANVEMDSQIYQMPNEVITGDGSKLFDHIAECMAKFISGVKLKGENLAVGFTFSFPCKQSGIASAVLLTWTKGFNASGVVGKDVAQLLREALARRGDIKAEIIAVVNDTVGTMMSCAFDHPSCCVGLIVGTGSNACYMEKKSNIDLVNDNSGDMCINMEWGAFGDDGALKEFRNEYDDVVDKNSLNPGKQKFEKMISGMYMGEVVRLILMKLISDGLLLQSSKESQKALSKPGSFETAYVSKIESKIGFGMTAVQNLLFNVHISAMKTDCEIISRICRAVCRRSAYMCAAGIAAVVHKIKESYPEKKKVTVGVDGTVYKKHPTFKDLLSDKVQMLCKGTGIDVEFALSFDGSGKGAALITAVARRLAQTKSSK